MISAARIGPLLQLHGRENANVYQNLLKQHVVPSHQATSNQPAVFTQDSACHTAKRVKLFGFPVCTVSLTSVSLDLVCTDWDF